MTQSLPDHGSEARVHTGKPSRVREQIGQGLRGQGGITGLALVYGQAEPACEGAQVVRCVDAQHTLQQFGLDGCGSRRIPRLGMLTGYIAEGAQGVRVVGAEDTFPVSRELLEVG